MHKSAAILFRTSVLSAAILLGACQGNDELASLDNQILANEADPALTSALEDQILVDPALAQQSNRLAVRPPETPVQAQYPTGRQASVTRSASSGAQPLGAAAGGACGGEFDYNSAWARRLPAAFAVYPGAKLTEAAGNKGGNCRVVTFTSADTPQRLLEWYNQRAVGAGYSAERQVRGQDHVLAGTNGDAAFYLIVTPHAGGSEASLIANEGA